jgi:hypothetical protein
MAGEFARTCFAKVWERDMDAVKQVGTDAISDAQGGQRLIAAPCLFAIFLLLKSLKDEVPSGEFRL